MSSVNQCTCLCVNGRTKKFAAGGTNNTLQFGYFLNVLQQISLEVFFLPHWDGEGSSTVPNKLVKV